MAIVLGTNASNVLIGTAGPDQIFGFAGDDTLFGNEGDDLLFGGRGSDSLFGGLGDDALFGAEGDDVLEGGAGADLLFGGPGADAASFAADPTGVTVNLQLGEAIDGFGSTDRLFGIENVVGSDFADEIVGDDRNNVLDGRAGDDRIAGGAGDDTLRGGLGLDVLVGDAGDDQLDGGLDGAFVSYLGDPGGVAVVLAIGEARDGFGDMDELRNIFGVIGSAFNDLLIGDDNANVFVGAGGSFDVISGLGGVDTVSYQFDPAGVGVDLGFQLATDGLGGDDVLIGIENVIGSPFADGLTGNNADNVLDGLAGNDILNGLFGDDVILGGPGNDHVRGGQGNDFLAAGEGNDTVGYGDDPAGVRVILPAGLAFDGHGTQDFLSGFENVDGSAFDDIITGDDGDNRLDGAAGADILNGGAGFDTLNGGFGDDVLNGGANSDDLIGGPGSDTASHEFDPAGVSVDLVAGIARDGFGFIDGLAGIENVLGSNHDDHIIGNAEDNVLDGGAGIDTIDYSKDTGPVVVNLEAQTALDGSLHPDAVRRFENVIGSAFSDMLRGESQSNVVEGRDGDDILIGRGGADLLDGGAGTKDRADYSEDPPGVRVDLSMGFAIDGFGDRDTLIGIEDVTGSTGDDTIIGDANDNALDGDFGDDLIIGGPGNDFLSGGPGDDLLTGDEGTDSFSGGFGNDTISFSADPGRVEVNLAEGFALDGFLPFNDREMVFLVENVIGSDFNDEIIGDHEDNVLGGLGGDDTMVGGAGADVLDGGPGDDTVSYADDPGRVEVNLAQGTAFDGFLPFNDVDTVLNFENVIGSAFDDEIVGNDAPNILEGRDGNDRFLGSGADDVIRGGAGEDEAVFRGNHCDYTVTRNADGSITVADKVAGRDAVDTLFDVEKITFADLEKFDTGRITPGNSAPVPANDRFIITEIVPLQLTGTNLLDNDCDFDGDPLTIVGIENVIVAGGTAEITLIDGELLATFTPFGDGVVADGEAEVQDIEPVPEGAFQASFDYIVSDDHGNTAVASVTVVQDLDLVVL